MVCSVCCVYICDVCVVCDMCGVEWGEVVVWRGFFRDKGNRFYGFGC